MKWKTVFTDLIIGFSHTLVILSYAAAEFARLGALEVNKIAQEIEDAKAKEQAQLEK